MPNTTLPEPILPISRVAMATGLPVRTLRGLIRRGEVPSVRIGPRGLPRVRVSAVLGAIQEIGVQTAPTDMTPAPA